MDDRHEPRPDFVANLEWQVRTALRRRDRFAEPTRGNGGRLTRGSVGWVSARVGAGGVGVGDEVQQSRRQEILLQRVETELRLAELEVTATRSQLDRFEEMATLVGEESLLFSREIAVGLFLKNAQDVDGLLGLRKERKSVG